MSSLIFFPILTLFLSVRSETTYRDEDCPRIRKPFHTLSEEERMQYVNGFQSLRKNGKLKVISTTHAANVAVHKGASFFAFHAYMIWEAETAIRELGTEYECFSMPYWDYTIDSGLESDPTIFHLSVGGNGLRQNNFGMSDPLWQTTNYWSTDGDTCMGTEQRSPPMCALKRSVSDTQLLPNAMEIAAVYIKNRNFLLFETQIDHYHVWPHFYLAVDTHSVMATAYAVDDPIFFLLHTFTLYQRALWMTCYEYDKIDIDQLQYFRDAYTPSCNPNMADCGVVGIDAAYNLNPLNEQSWTVSSRMDITPRMLYDIRQWNVKYDLGPFYTNSKLNEWCEFRAMHRNSETGLDVYGPNPDLFMDLTATYAKELDSDVSSSAGVIGALIRNNYLQSFIDETWDELKSKQSELGMSDDEVYLAVESLSCKYHRSKSENSCFETDFESDKYETCQSRNIWDKNEITLEGMLGFEGVKSNQCLRKRRKQIYSVTQLDDSIKLKLCNGDYDYQCNEWVHPSFGQREYDLMIETGKLELVSSYQSQSFDFAVLISLCVFIAMSLACFVWRKWCDGSGNNGRDKGRYDVEYGTF